MGELKLESITLGGGCFWCAEAIFQEIRGVQSVVSGYTGGNAPGKPTYREVCSGLTGHAEVVRVTFDNSMITLYDILHIFMTTHDPTTLNRQGADVGTQYRSAIYYINDDQKKIAEHVLADVSKLYENPIITELTPMAIFYEAEEYHQDYYKNNPSQAYCQVVIDPKLAKLRKLHANNVN